MPARTLWNCPTDWGAQDTTLQISYPSTDNPVAEITTVAPGAQKWVFVALRPAVDGPIRAVRICYQLSDSSSFISRVRLIELQTPEPAVIRHDDTTDLLSTDPACHVIDVGLIRPTGAFTLALRLKFADTSHKIRLGPVGVDVETCGIEVANVRCFGAVGDGTADDAGAIQAAIDMVGNAGGGTVYFPPGTYLTGQPLQVFHDGVAFRGAGQDITAVQTASSDLLIVSDTRLVRRFALEDIELTSLSGGGHVIVVPAGMGQSTIRAARLVQRNDDRSIYRLHLADDGNDDDDDPADKVSTGGYNNLVTESWLRGPAVPTVPQWDVVVHRNRYNSNVFERVRCDFSGDFFFHLEATRGALAGNSFRDIVFERCSGGKIRLLSCANTLMQECVAYDEVGITKDGFYVGKSPGNPIRSTYTTIINCQRQNGVLSGGFKDIKLTADECLATTVINCGGRGSAGITHDFGDTPTTAIGMSDFVTLEGTAQATLVSSDGITSPNP